MIRFRITLLATLATLATAAGIAAAGEFEPASGHYAGKAGVNDGVSFNVHFESRTVSDFEWLGRPVFAHAHLERTPAGEWRFHHVGGCLGATGTWTERGTVHGEVRKVCGFTGSPKFHAHHVFG